MRSFIVASHGRYAGGLAHTIDLISGKTGVFHVLDAYEENVPVAEEVSRILGTIDSDDELVILTDLVGGSVNQEFARVTAQRPGTTLIAGANVPLALQLATHPAGKPLTDEKIDKYIELSRSQIVHVNRIDTSLGEDDE